MTGRGEYDSLGRPTGGSHRAGGVHRANESDPTVILPAITEQTPRQTPEPGEADPAAPTHILPPSERFTPQVETETVPMTAVPPDSVATAAPGPDVDATVTLPRVVDEDADRDDTGAVVARHGATMAVASIVSRITGFLRTAAIGAAIGAAAVSDDYNLANTLPNMVYELLLGGVLASVVVPLLVRARTRDPDKGEAYAQRLLTLAALFLFVATAIAVLAAPLLTRALATESSAADQRLITILAYLLLPEIFFYGLAAVFAAVLNTRGHFAAPAFTPILNNLVVIATAGVFILLPVATPLRADALTMGEILVLGLGTTLGIVVQAVGLWPALRKVGFRWKWRWDFRQLRLGELARVGLWMLCYVAISQVGVVVVLKIAKLAGDGGGPGPAIYSNAWLIFMMAHGVVAVSIITALMPRMSRAAAERRFPDLVEQLSLGTRMTAVVLVPAMAIYVVLGRPLAVTLFFWGEYTLDQALATGSVLAVAGLGLLPFAVSQLQIFAFYALPDTRTPALINIPAVAVRVGVDIMFYLVLPTAWVVAGLMGGNALSFTASGILGYWLLSRRVGQLDLKRVASTVGRLLAAVAIASVPAGLAAWGIHSLMGDGKLGSAVQLVVGVALLLAAYVPLAVIFRVREVRDLVGMVRSRLGREVIR